MPEAPLKKIRPLGETSIECTPSGAVSSTRGEPANPVRVTFRSTARIVPVFTSPKMRSPLRAAPKRQLSQKAAPVMPIVALK